MFFFFFFFRILYLEIQLHTQIMHASSTLIKYHCNQPINTPNPRLQGIIPSKRTRKQKESKQQKTLSVYAYQTEVLQ